MRIQLLQAAHLGGKSYALGIHDLPEKAIEDRFFHKLVQAGLAVEPEASAFVAPESLQDRQKRLADKLVKASDEKALAARKAVIASQEAEKSLNASGQEAQAPAAQDNTVTEDGESEDQDSEESSEPATASEAEGSSKKHHKKHRK